MHIHIVPGRGVPAAVLMAKSYREASKLRQRTVANLSSLSAKEIEAPHSKLAITRGWRATTLATDVGVPDAEAGDLYAATDWLL